MKNHRWYVASAGLAVVLAAAVIAVQATSGAASSPRRGIDRYEHVVNMEKLHRSLAQAEKRRRLALAARGDRVWQPRHLGGAIRMAKRSYDTSGGAECSAASLSTAYWTSVPSLSQVINGFNVTNTGLVPCYLPVYPTNITLVNANGSSEVVPTLPTPDGLQSVSDFVPLTSDPSGPASASADYAADPAPLELQPGGVAVILLYGSYSAADGTPQGSSCISGSTGGGLQVSLGAAEDLVVSVPTASQLVTQDDPAGSAFVSCASVFSPFLTWSQAAAVVGSPTPSSSAGSLVLADEPIYINAP